MAAIQVTPTVGNIHLDTQRGVYKGRATREEDLGSRHTDGKELREFLTLLEAIAWLLQFWAAAGPTVETSVPSAAASIGDKAAFKAWVVANL